MTIMTGCHSGCGYHAFSKTFTHMQDCPNHPNNLAKQHIPEPVASVTSIGAARFKRTDSPAHLDPRAALEAALEWYDGAKAHNEDPPTHVIVIIGSDVGPEGCSGTKYFQAGGYRHHAQMGLCLEGMEMMRESGQ